MLPTHGVLRSYLAKMVTPTSGLLPTLLPFEFAICTASPQKRELFTVCPLNSPPMEPGPRPPLATVEMLYAVVRQASFAAPAMNAKRLPAPHVDVLSLKMSLRPPEVVPETRNPRKESVAVVASATTTMPIGCD